jgi:predicted component of type VI protein secretion system
MPTLHVLSGPDLGRAFRVESGALIGRSAECAVALSAASISRRHARLEQVGGRWQLVDLDSRNGIATAADAGRRVPRVELVDADEFVVGDVRMRLRLEVAAASTPATPAEPAPRAAAADLPEIELEPHTAPPAHRASAAEVRRLQPPSPGAMPPDAERTAILRRDHEASAGGWLTGDLEQWPPALKLVAGLVAIAVCAGVAYACFALASALRS